LTARRRAQFTRQPTLRKALDGRMAIAVCSLCWLEPIRGRAQRPRAPAGTELARRYRVRALTERPASSAGSARNAAARAPQEGVPQQPRAVGVQHAPRRRHEQEVGHVGHRPEHPARLEHRRERAAQLLQRLRWRLPLRSGPRLLSVGRATSVPGQRRAAAGQLRGGSRARESRPVQHTPTAGWPGLPDRSGALASAHLKHAGPHKEEGKVRREECQLAGKRLQRGLQHHRRQSQCAGVVFTSQAAAAGALGGCQERPEPAAAAQYSEGHRAAHGATCNTRSSCCTTCDTGQWAHQAQRRCSTDMRILPRPRHSGVGNSGVVQIDT